MKKSADGTSEGVTHADYITQVLSVAFFYVYTHQDATMLKVAEFVENRLGCSELNSLDKNDCVNDILNILVSLVEQGHILEKKRNSKVCLASIK